MHPSVKAVVDDYWSARHGKSALQPGTRASREELVVRHVPARQRAPNAALAEARRMIDPARLRRPPDPPSRPAAAPQFRSPEPRRPIDVAEAEAEIMRAEARALQEKARARHLGPHGLHGPHEPKPRSISDAERDDMVRRELRRVEEAAWERHLGELRWQEKKRTEDRRSFEDQYCRKGLGGASGAPLGRAATASRSMSQPSCHDAPPSPVASQRSSAAEMPPWLNAARQDTAPPRQHRGSQASHHRRQSSLAPAAPDSLLRPAGSQQSIQQASEAGSQRGHAEAPSQASVSPSAGAPSSRASHSSSAAAADTARATLACLLLAHLLHNTGADTGSPPLTGDAHGRVEAPGPPARGPIDCYRRYSGGDPEAIDLEDGPPLPSPVHGGHGVHGAHGAQRQGSVRPGRPSGPRDPRRPSRPRSSFSSSVAPSDSVSVVSAASAVSAPDRDAGPRAPTPPSPPLPPSPAVDDPPEDPLPLPLPAPVPSVRQARYAFADRSSPAPPGYVVDAFGEAAAGRRAHDLRQDLPAMPASPPPQYSASASAGPPSLASLRASKSKPATLYHSSHTAPSVSRPHGNHPPADCIVQ